MVVIYIAKILSENRGYPMVDIHLLNNVSDELKKQKLSIATAESCTGGLLAHYLTNISGSSEYYYQGVISYSNIAKIDLLDVSENIIETYGAVSKQTARAMAIGIKEKAHVDIGISTTGVAGPTGGTKEKPIGLVFVGISTSKNTEVIKFIFKGDRLQNKENTCTESLKLLLENITR